jgi:alpha-tubulin suppressor-like RCC1 family protein
LKRISTAIAISALAGVLANACTDDAEPVRVDIPDASSDTAAPDGELPAQDAGVDAPRDASYDAADEPVTCAVTPCAVALAAGDNHVCALISDGTVRCWGDNFKGALGRGATDAGENDAGVGPIQVADVTNATQISAAGWVTCVRIADGSVKCWGKNEKGQLGLTTEGLSFDEDPHPTPAKVALAGTASRVDVGYDTTCARLASGEQWCWGANDQNQLLRPDDGPVGAPSPLTLDGQTPVKWTSTAFGSVTGYAITEDASLVTWGVVSGRNTSFPFDPEPHVLPSLSGVTDIAAGPASVALKSAFSHTCAIAAGSVYCWGKTSSGDVPAFCTGVPNDQRVPVLAPLSGTAFPQQIAVAQTRTCVRLTDGTIECCGDDSRGQLGLGKVSANRTVLSFTRASALEGYAVQVVTGSTMTCALLREGRVACWGGNERGELGQSTVDSSPHPTPLTVSF